jgi:hypothetical protein
MPTILKDNIDFGYCRMRATRDEIIQHFKENKGTRGKVQLHNGLNDTYEPINPDILPDREYEFTLHLLPFGTVINIKL